MEEDKRRRKIRRRKINRGGRQTEEEDKQWRKVQRREEGKTRREEGWPMTALDGWPDRGEVWSNGCLL
jgi:hypothetical protein